MRLSIIVTGWRAARVGGEGRLSLPVGRLQVLYQQCILEHPTESHAKNVDAMLWRHCFYQPIDYYRRQLKNHPQSSSGRWALAELNRHIDAGFAFLACLVQSLVVRGGGFVPDGGSLDEMLHALGLPHLPERRSSSAPVPGLDIIVYRLLIFCGDLARYRTQFNQSFQSDHYRLAWRLYQAALRLQPDHGHAANQMAVVASLLGDPLTAVLWYLRAECCAVPFAAARHNLVSFLERQIDTAPLDQSAIGAPDRLFLLFLHRAMTSASFVVAPVADWLGRRGDEMADGRRYSLLLMILSATAHTTEDPHGSFEEAIDLLLASGIPTIKDDDDEDGEAAALLLLVLLTHATQVGCHAYASSAPTIRLNLSAPPPRMMQKFTLTRSMDKVQQILYSLARSKVDPARQARHLIGLSGFHPFDGPWGQLARAPVAELLPGAFGPSASAAANDLGGREEQDEVVMFRGLGTLSK